MSKEMVNHPSHYNLDGRKECIVEMEEQFGVKNVATWCYMTAYKYLYRMGNKGDAEEDIDKASWYVDYVDALCDKWNTESFDVRMEQQLKQSIKDAKKKLRKMKKEEKTEE